MTATPFTKMHGHGNDFVVIDARDAPLALSADAINMIAARRTGIGCDQVLVIEGSGSAAAFMRVYNADGSESGACGNGTRCVGSILMAEGRTDSLALETIAGILAVEKTGPGRITADMGPARTDWQDIPLQRHADTAHVPVGAGPLKDAACVNLGNPHAVYFVDDPARVDLGTLGPKIETDPFFMEGANVSVARVEGPRDLRLRVWERGAGLTRACGSAACAALVCASRRGLMQRAGTVHLPGGDLEIEWRDDGHVLMTGPVASSFVGTFDLESLTAARP